MRTIAINTIEDGICRTILATYHKVGTCNVFEHNFPAVMEVSRTLKCDDSACVCVEELIDNDMEKKNVLTPDERKAIIKRVRIRKLTPKTCWRLMGVSDADFEKARAAGISDSRLYQLAGNSIVVPVLEGIFTQLFREDNECLF